jgi:hypothetical protein
LNEGNRFGTTEKTIHPIIKKTINTHDSTIKLLLQRAFKTNIKNTRESDLIIKNFKISILKIML